MGVTYDTGALIAADRGDRHMWARHRALLSAGKSRRRRYDLVVSSDPEDLAALAAAVNRRLEVERP